MNRCRCEPHPALAEPTIGRPALRLGPKGAAHTPRTALGISTGGAIGVQMRLRHVRDTVIARFQFYIRPVNEAL